MKFIGDIDNLRVSSADIKKLLGSVLVIGGLLIGGMLVKMPIESVFSVNALILVLVVSIIASVFDMFYTIRKRSLELSGAPGGNGHPGDRPAGVVSAKIVLMMSSGVILVSLFLAVASYLA